MVQIYKTPFAAQGDKDAIPVPVQGDGAVSVTQGFGYDYEREYEDPAAKDIRREIMNGILHDFSEAIGEMQQFGFAAWQPVDGGWPIGANVNHGGGVWQSLANANTEEPGAGVLWKPIAFSKLASLSESQAGVNQENLMTPHLTAVLFPFRGIQVYDAAGTFEWTRMAGVTNAWAIVVGGGGSAGKTSTANIAPGGGGGGMAQGLVDVSSVSSVSVTVGAGGVGAAGPSDGVPGGSSSFGVFLSASGGEGARPGGVSPGRGGIGTGGDINTRGGAGGAAINPANSQFGGAYGGASSMAPGGSPTFGSYDSIETDGKWPGGGGGGASSVASQTGSGAAGAVIIIW